MSLENKRFFFGTLSTVSAVLATIGTASGNYGIVKRVLFNNTGATTASVTITVGDVSMIGPVILDANTPYPVEVDQIIESGEEISGVCDTASQVICALSGREGT